MITVTFPCNDFKPHVIFHHWWRVTLTTVKLGIYRSKDRNGAVKLMIIDDTNVEKPYNIYFFLQRSNLSFADMKLTVVSAYRNNPIKPRQRMKLGTELDRCMNKLPKPKNKMHKKRRPPQREAWRVGEFSQLSRLTVPKFRLCGTQFVSPLATCHVYTRNFDMSILCARKLNMKSVPLSKGKIVYSVNGNQSTVLPRPSNACWEVDGIPFVDPTF